MDKLFSKNDLWAMYNNAMNPPKPRIDLSQIMNTQPTPFRAPQVQAPTTQLNMMNRPGGVPSFNQNTRTTI